MEGEVGGARSHGQCPKGGAVQRYCANLVLRCCRVAVLRLVIDSRSGGVFLILDRFQHNTPSLSEATTTGLLYLSRWAFPILTRVKPASSAICLHLTAWDREVTGRSAKWNCGWKANSA